jgi:DNA-binding transcriptional MocR family regulator
MHLVAWLSNGVSDRDTSQRAAAAGIGAPPLSAYYHAAAARPALLLGYSSITARKIHEGARRLAAAMID